MSIFPDVPDVPGVPALLRNTQGAITNPILLVQDTVGALLGFGPSIWGIFDADNNPVITADSVVGFEYMQDWRIPDYPQEAGAFQSYNKVATPYRSKVSFAAGGNQANRQSFLDQLEQTAASLALYNVVTPEKTYVNANIEHVDYRRTARNGVGLLIADVWLVEIRQTGTADYSSTKAPSGAGQVNGGRVQTTTAAPAQRAAASAVT